MGNNFKNMPLNQKARGLTAAELAEYGAFPAGTLGLKWEEGDDNPDWIPQGITSFQRDGQYVALISWYYKPPGSNHNKVRISYLNRTPDANGIYWYGHAYLSGEISRMHAGGLAFRYSRLYVAKTSYGVISFDVLNPILKGDEWQIDQIDSYNLAAAIEDPTKKVFSFLDIDWTNNKLLSGVYATYSAQHNGTRFPAVHSWGFVNEVPVTQDVEEHLKIQNEYSSRYRNLQGVARYGSTWYYSQSHNKHSIRREIEGGTSSDIVHCDKGLEDLHITSTGNYLMGLTEHTGHKIVFQIDLRNL